MPNNIRQQALWLGSTGDPESFNEPTLQYPGMLGVTGTIKQPFSSAPGAESGRSKSYQLVATDSSMSVAPFPGAVAWWGDKTKYQVTTNPATLGRNRIAGVFQGFITKGNFCYVQTGGPATVKFIDTIASQPTATSSLQVIPSATSGKADTLAAGTAPTYATLGTTSSAYNATEATAIVDLDVPQTT